MVLGDEAVDSGAGAVFPVVLGCVRSGTTMLRAMLDSHPDLAVPPESYFVEPALKERARYESGGSLDLDRLLADIAAERSFPDWQLGPAALAEVREQTPRTVADALLALYRAYAHQHGKPRAGDKTPSHLLHIELLAHAFPRARFLHIVRDGRDVVPSIQGMSFGPDRFSDAVFFWARRMELGLAGGAMLGPERYRQISYESLVADPEGVLRDVCPFLDLEYSADMVHYYERADELLDGMRATRHVQGVRRPPTRGLRDWRTALASRDIALFEALTGDLLERLGYERSGMPIPGHVRVEARALRLAHQLDRQTWTLRARVARKLTRRPMPVARAV